MEFEIMLLSFASGISMLLVIYAAYMMVRFSKGEFSNAFKIILLGHLPLAAVHFLLSISYFGIGPVLKDNFLIYMALNYGGQIISALSVFLAIYLVKRALFDKISNFTKKAVRRHG